MHYSCTSSISTCVTSLLSSVGASRNARRAAVMHLSFNVIGTIIFMLVLNKPISAIVTHFDPTDTARQIANAHTLFNLINVIILIPFAKFIVNIAIKLVPDKDEKESKETKYLDERMLETPSIALGNVVKEIVSMGNQAKESLQNAINSFLDQDNEKALKCLEQEKNINKLQKHILNYLLKLSKCPLDDNERELVDLMFNTVNDIERIGDHAENIAELAQSSMDSSINLSSQSQTETKEIYDKVLLSIEYAIKALQENDQALAQKVLEIENEVDAMDKAFRSNHMLRLNQSKCSVDSGVLYLDLLSNLERIADHSLNIAQRVM